MAGQRRDPFTAARSLGATPTATLTSISQQPLPRTHPGLNRAISHKGESALPLERTFGCSEGNEVTVVGAARVPLGIAICYELEIPEYSAALADRGAVNDEEVAVAARTGRLLLAFNSGSLQPSSHFALRASAWPGGSARLSNGRIGQRQERFEMAVIVDRHVARLDQLRAVDGHVSSHQETDTAGAPALV